MYKRPESVLVVVIARSRAETLLLLRREPRNFWQSVTGSLLEGETPAAAARRELAEETGIVARPEPTAQVVDYPILPAWRNRYAPGTQTNREYQFVYRCERAGPITVAGHEHRAYAWLGYGEAIRRLASKANREALERLSK